MTDTFLQLIADRHIPSVLRHFVDHAPGAVVTQTESALLVASAAERGTAYHNAAVRLDRKTDPDAVIKDMREFEAASGRRLLLWTSGADDADLEHAALDAGLQLRVTTTGMAITERPDLPADEHGNLTWVTDLAGVEAFAHVHTNVRGDGTGVPAEIVGHFASPGALLAPNVRAAVLHLNDRPVACAMVVCTGLEAGIYWVATTADVRRRGYGERVSRAVTCAGFELGAETVLLQATQLGESIYQKIGFKSFTTYHQYG